LSVKWTIAATCWSVFPFTFCTVLSQSPEMPPSLCSPQAIPNTITVLPRGRPQKTWNGVVEQDCQIIQQMHKE